MNTWLKYLLPLSIISINGWAAEPYQMQLPLKPSVLVEATQKNHILNASDHQSVNDELKILSQNYWSAYQGAQLTPQCVLRVQESTPNRAFIPLALSLLNDNQGMIYIENPINDAQGGVATGIPQKNIPTIARICQNYWQPAIKNN